VKVIKSKRDPVVRAINIVMFSASTLEMEAKRPPTASSTTTPDTGRRSVSTEDRATNTPCWWESGPLRPQLEKRIPTNKTADRTEQKETTDNTREPEFKVASSMKRRGKMGTNKVPTEQTAKVDTAALETLKAVQGKRRRPPRT